MATSRQRRKSSSSNAKGGGAMFGVLVGLIIGLAAAAGVAYFVTQVPMPFVDKASRAPAQTLLPDARDAPDPNMGLYGANGPAGQQAQGPVTTTPAAPSPDTPPAKPDGQDDIGALLATLGTAAQSAGQPASGKPTDPASAPAQTPAPSPAQPAAQKPVPPPAAKPAAPAQTSTTYYLQAGAFRSETDAQSVRGRIIMMGLPVQVQSAQVNGSQLYRVRVGPFRGIDEMNRSRMQLSEAKIESTVVRP